MRTTSPSAATFPFAVLFCAASFFALTACGEDDPAPGGGGAGTSAAGKAGSAGAVGGGAGTGANAGTGGSAGKGGSSGSAGKGGTAGTGGSAGKGGAAGIGGSAGSSAGAAGAAGSSAGAAGSSAGAAGSSGGAAGSSAGAAGSSAGAAGSSAGAAGSSAGAAGSSAGAAGAAGSGPAGCGTIANDTAVPAGESTISGSLVAKNDKVKGTCSADGAVDEIFRLVPAVTGKLRLELSSATPLQPTLVLDGSSCGSGELACTVSSVLEVPNVEAGKPYHLIVEGAAPGVYAVKATLTKSGVDVCGQTTTPLAVAKGNGVLLEGTTATGTSTIAPPAACSAAASGKERFFSVKAVTAGTLTFDLETGSKTADFALNIVSDCANANSSLACVNAEGAGGIESVTVAATAGATYYVVVDTVGAAEGDFSVSVNLQ